MPKFENCDQVRTEELYLYLLGALMKGGHAGRGKMSKALNSEGANRGRTLYDKLTQHRPLYVSELSESISELQRSIRAGNTTIAKKTKHVSLITPKEVRLAFLKLIELTPHERLELGLKHGDEQILMQQALLHIWGEQDRQSYERVLDFYNASIGLTSDKDEALTDYSEDVLEEEVRGIARQHLSHVALHDNGFQSVDNYIDSNYLVAIVMEEIDRIFLKAGADQLYLSRVQGRQDYGSKYLPKEFIQRLTKTAIDNAILTADFPVFIESVSIKEREPFPLLVRKRYLSRVDPIDTDNHDSSNVEKPSLSVSLLKLSEFEEHNSNEVDCSELATQSAHRITIKFYIKVKKGDLKVSYPDAYSGLRSVDDEDAYERIYFTISSIGISGVHSHIIRAINNAVLTDVDAVARERVSATQAMGITVNLRKEFFPIAHDVLLSQNFPKRTAASPVWAHSLVMLCKNNVLSDVMTKSRLEGKLVPYTDQAFGEQVGQGDYCGFDLVKCCANAALNARLRAIRYTGIDSHDYIQALYNRVEKKYLLDKASSFVKSYPYSSLAQESFLQTTLFKDFEHDLTEDDPNIVFTAYLRVIETFLNEGNYSRAWPYLEKVAPVLGRDTDWYDQFGKTITAEGSQYNVFSGSLVARFAICMAQYFAIVDAEIEADVLAQEENNMLLPSQIAWDKDDRENVYWSQNARQLQQQLVERSWAALEAAEKHLSTRIAKYSVINEESQGACYPHYKFLSQIYFLRAKLCIFFPALVPAPDQAEFYKIPSDRSDSPSQRCTQLTQVVQANRLFLMEKARLYSVCDGEITRYSNYTALQSWMYLMAAYNSETLTIQNRVGYLQMEISRKDAFLSARRLRDEALLAYSTRGRRCYLEMKEKSGLSKRLQNLRDKRIVEYGCYQIESIPPFQEKFEEGGSKISVGQNKDSQLLELDMSLLAISSNELSISGHSDSQGSIYLFGPNASYLFFSRAVYMLCSDDRKEFQEHAAFQGRQYRATTLSDWRSKIDNAYRLFNYAWAIADEGGELQQDSSSQSGDLHWQIERTFSDEKTGGLPEPAALRDLYPLRIGGITGLGRVFAAWCSTLKIYLYKKRAEKERLAQKSSWLFSNIYRNDGEESDSLEVERYEYGDLGRNNRYNGHLTGYINACRGVLEREIEQAKQYKLITPTDFAAIRTKGTQKLFDLLMRKDVTNH